MAGEADRAGLRANAAFLMSRPTSDYADDALMHTARDNSVKKDFRAELSAYLQLVNRYPHSDMADDGCWGLARMHRADQDHVAAINALNTLITTWPQSTWADDAHLAIAHEFREVDDEAGYLQALEGMVRKHPRADCCARGLSDLANKYREVENYAVAIAAREGLIARYPYSEYLDDALFCTGESLPELRRSARCAGGLPGAERGAAGQQPDQSGHAGGEHPREEPAGGGRNAPGIHNTEAEDAASLAPLGRARLAQDFACAPFGDNLMPRDLTHIHHCRPAFGRAQTFPEAASFSIEISSAWSATSFLSCVFSSSNSLRRFAWSTRMPPYSFRHR